MFKTFHSISISFFFGHYNTQHSQHTMSSQWVQWSIHKYYADDKDSIKYESLRIPAQPDGHQKVATNRPHTDAQIIDQEGVEWNEFFRDQSITTLHESPLKWAVKVKTNIKSSRHSYFPPSVSMASRFNKYPFLALRANLLIIISSNL